MSGGEGGFSFIDIYSFFVFLMALWVVGKLSVMIKVPSIVGEILAGLILGPHFLHLAPYSDVLKMIGECGLILLVIEAGIEVDLDILKVIGPRGVLVAVFGSMTPLAMGFGLGLWTGASIPSALAIGACLAPTSMGIAVNCLRRGKQLNTTIGQLVIAAAVLDDIISLVLLSVIQALKDPTPWGCSKPLVVSTSFLCGFGYLGIYIMPTFLPKVMKMFDHKWHDYILLGLVMICSLTLIPATNYAGTSYLLGAFLAGLLFCSDHHVHVVWNKQMKRLMAWLLRLFFACTIGFEVPIKDVWTKEIISKTFLFFIPIIGKLATGIFAPKPWRFVDACKLGSAMSAWGEFAFIIATVSKSDHLLDSSQFSSVVMAVLLSVIFGPVALTVAINYDNAHKDEQLDLMKAINEEIIVDKDMENHVYYKICTKSRAIWGYYDKMEDKIAKLNLEVMDYRTNHTFDGTRNVMTEFYVRDDTAFKKDTSQKIEKRRRAIAGNIGRALEDIQGNVSVTLWVPRVSESTSDCNGSGQPVKGQDRVCDLRIAKKFKRRHCCKLDDTIAQVAQRMTRECVSCVLVVEELKDEVLGMITQTDIIRDLPNRGVEHVHHAKDIMTLKKDLLVCDKNATRKEILHEMANGNCQHMVLIDIEHALVETVVNIKTLCSDVVAASNDMGSMTNVLQQHYDDHREEKQWSYRLGMQNRAVKLDGPFNDGQPITWDNWQKLSTRGSICLESADFPVFAQLESSDSNSPSKIEDDQANVKLEIQMNAGGEINHIVGTNI